MTWQPGQTITRREVLHGQLWMDHPVAVVTVVADDGEVFAVHPRTRVEVHFHDHPGRIDLETVGAVLEAANGVVDLLDGDDRWWSSFDGWIPANS